MSGTFPTEWSMEFEGNKHRYQNAIFTEFYNLENYNNHMSFKTFNVLYILNKSSIGKTL